MLRNNGKINEAVKLYMEARVESQEIDNKWLASECLHMIGVSFYQDKKFKEAEEFLNQSKEEFDKLGDNDLVAAVLRDLSQIAKSQKDFDEATELIQQSIDLLKNSQKQGHLGISQVKLGMILADQENLEEAQTKIKIGIDNISKSPERFFEASAYFNLAEVQRKAGKEDEAKKSAEKSLQILDKLGNDKNQALIDQIKAFSEN